VSFGKIFTQDYSVSVLSNWLPAGLIRPEARPAKLCYWILLLGGTKLPIHCCHFLIYCLNLANRSISVILRRDV
jgi:hypothetical protein